MIGSWLDVISDLQKNMQLRVEPLDSHHTITFYYYQNIAKVDFLWLDGPRHSIISQRVRVLRLSQLGHMGLQGPWDIRSMDHGSWIMERS
jgi:hypothetical protein